MFSEVQIEDTNNRRKSYTKGDKPMHWTIIVYLVILESTFIYLSIINQYKFDSITNYQSFRRFHTWLQGDFDFVIGPISRFHKDIKIFGSIVRAYLNENESMDLTMNISKQYYKKYGISTKNSSKQIHPKFIGDERISDPFIILDEDVTSSNQIVVNVSLIGNVLNATGMKLIYNYTDPNTNLFTMNLRLFSFLIVIYPIYKELIPIFNNKTFNLNNIIYIIFCVSLAMCSNAFAYVIPFLNNKFLDLFLQFIYSLSHMFVSLSLINFPYVYQFKQNQTQIYLSAIIISFILNILEAIAKIKLDFIGPLSLGLSFHPILTIVLIVLYILAFIWFIYVLWQNNMIDVSLSVIIIPMFNLLLKIYVYSLAIVFTNDIMSLFSSSLLFTNNILCGSAIVYFNFLHHGEYQNINLELANIPSFIEQESTDSGSVENLKTSQD